MAHLKFIEGVGAVYGKKLNQAGVASTKALRETGATAKGRKELAQKTGISETLLLKWVNRVDLFRVKGIGEQYADLLEVAGVDSVPELAQRRVDHLYQKLAETNEAKKLVRKLPAISQLKAWIDQAKKLPRQITY